MGNETPSHRLPSQLEELCGTKWYESAYGSVLLRVHAVCPTLLAVVEIRSSHKKLPGSHNYNTYPDDDREHHIRASHVHPQQHGSSLGPWTHLSYVHRERIVGLSLMAEAHSSAQRRFPRLPVQGVSCFWMTGERT
jgi:hypothetical protein